MNGFKEFFEKYKKPVILGGVGLLSGILMLTIGFFATLLLLLLTGLGVLIGLRPDFFKRMWSSLKSFFTKKRGKG